MDLHVKTFLWIVLVLLAAGFGIWIVKSNKTVDKLQEDLSATRKQMKQLENHSGASDGASAKVNNGTGGSRRPSKDDKIDWRAMSGILEQFNEGVDGPALDDMYDKMLSRMASMSQAELYEALDEIDSLGLSQVKQSELTAEVVDFLMERDPEGILKRFDDRIGSDDDVGSILAEAVGYMADKDPAAAVRWMDEKIKAGKFISKTLDGSSEARVEYESVLMARILGASGGEAIERIKALPIEDRLDVLEQMDLTELWPAAQSQYVEILRNLVPEDDREGAFGYMASELAYEGGFEAVDAFMKQVNPTPAERSAAASQAALGKILAISEDRALTGSDVDQMREWLQSNVSADVDQITGGTIGEAFEDDGYFDYEKAQKLALEYNEMAGNDQVLVGFLRSYAATENPDEAAKLLNLVKDPDLRMELAEELKE